LSYSDGPSLHSTTQVSAVEYSIGLSGGAEPLVISVNTATSAVQSPASAMVIAAMNPAGSTWTIPIAMLARSASVQQVPALRSVMSTKMRSTQCARRTQA
jgi:hypothetical protein